ncbi:uncharacterized protein LOC143213928 isoform X2 [Lasioglossum baleicum]|uniref:uncharacterized protein LOC143213928 isoform X2 n=1 Tax=Lasioglossum baleicum TaxID=434251 RepID=UPI003FCE8855
MGNGVIPLVVVAMVPIIAGSIGQRALEKRSTDNIDYADYDPVVVPKRAALLLDQLMVALQKVVDNQNRGELSNSRSYAKTSPHISTDHSQIISSGGEETMDLQRRGQTKEHTFWRCYFNAVACFKRKR